MSAQIGLDELYRLSIDDYHRLIEAGAFEDFPPCELIDGLLVRKDMKSREHENAIEWLARWLMFGVDQGRFSVRIGAALTLERSEPEPDLMVIARDVRRPYHPATATLAVEVSVSSLRRDLGRKAAIYAQAGVGEYWVFDVGARHLVAHRSPAGEGYAERIDLHAGERIARPPAGLPELVVDELLRATSA
ncbi:MAG: Uma2 family endonuclease [Solirubrobacteraceae bacterium]